MATIKIDNIEGGQGSRKFDRNGQIIWEYTRVATISDLSSSSDGDDIQADAVAALVSQEGGDIGIAYYPGRETCLLREFHTELISPSVVRVHLVYRDIIFNPAQIEVGASLAQVETNLDKDGNKITLSYTYPVGYKLDANKAGETITQGGFYTKLVPEATARYRRTELGSPLVKATQYVGRVNSGTFLGLSAGYWLCTSIVGRSDDGGYSFDVNYEFQVRQDGWAQKLVYINPDTGLPPEDIVDEVGAKTIDVYEDIDFDDLDL